ncbi:DUF3261 domain-containing protein [Wohlfahrtiimonas chitiniclastica]|uniref:DUF3261 domain-containing protein n=1 Tax=Wohlfahrtiimonas chitiniclastica TaxID=400946 RepID=UPI001BD07160|nr:DUF3261 domain-containing protein [Wohlfahrtiimonas chitiniclastica]MBS7826387.1 DUF3261 domain-containing protein [Wohlfahrtiimonas chitiniclastica]
MMKWLYTGILLMFLSGCAHPPKLAPTEFHLTQRLIAQLPAPKSHAPFHSQALITTAVRGHELSFMAMVTIQDHTLTLMALTPVGIRVFKTVYDGHTITTEQYLPNIPLPNMPEILGNFMLAHYDPQAWQGHLPETVHIHDAGLTRTLINDAHQTILTIEYVQNGRQKVPVQIHNEVLNYTLTLKNIQ